MDHKAMTSLITGAAGFIGSHLAQALLRRQDDVVGVDNFNPYYDVRLKEARAARLRQHHRYQEVRMDVADGARLTALFAAHRPRLVLHMAAQAGVRYSLENPGAYVSSNLVGFFALLEACRAYPPEHLVFASTSSVYGANSLQPFSPRHGANHPLTLYAATKQANEAMAHAYAHLFGIPCTGLRFFTVYGPWGRPDMALFLFTRAMLAGRPIQVFNQGNMARDFTYIDDVVSAVLDVAARPPAPAPATAPGAGMLDPATSPAAPFALYNIGYGKPVPLLRFIEVLEEALGLTAIKDMRPMQPGDVVETFADITDLTAATGFTPQVPVEVGVPRFVAWYLDHHGSPLAESRRQAPAAALCQGDAG